VTGPWPGTRVSTSSARMISNDSSHWSTSEVMSQVWQPEKTLSPVKTMRSWGT
jgi:hypothetical protein